MCGIAGYVGKRNAMVVLYDMLKRLEYRGYDSAGIAVIAENEIVFVKDRGKVSNLKKRILNMKISSNIGIAHTRWATHGIPSSKNAHPHSDCSGEITIVHNGIIENYRELKQELIERGHKFTSETDTEVIPHLIEELYKRNRDIESAFVSAIKKLRGSFAIAVINKHDDKILIARRESPLIVGLGNGENFIASDMPAIL
ncbi:MAG: glutamine--fructose-6-phosphate aminotransferase, partial [Candidatus Altiarchaeales archaeon]